MRRVVGLFVALLVAAPADANVARSGLPRDTEFLLMSYGAGGAMSLGANLSGTVVGSKAITITRVSVTVISASGGGAGNTVVAVSGGGQDCLATVACANTSSGTPKSIAATLSGSCTFAPGTALYASVSAAGCTTTQPTVRTINWIAHYP